MTERWVALDVGETLVNETRIWSAWADVVGVPRLTFMAGLGSVIARGGQHQEVFALFGSDDWHEHRARLDAAVGPLRHDDLYPDALPAFHALRAAGYRLAILANQPARVSDQLRALGFDPEVMAQSDEMRLFKPDPAFFARGLELMGSPDAADVAYVGDRIDNDVIPALDAGWRAVHVRRGPWGYIQQLPAGVVPALRVDSLAELVDRIGEAWV